MKRTNQLSHRASQLLQRANQLLQRANQLSQRANQLLQRANQLLQRANQLLQRVNHPSQREPIRYCSEPISFGNEPISILQRANQFAPLFRVRGAGGEKQDNRHPNAENTGRHFPLPVPVHALQPLYDELICEDEKQSAKESRLNVQATNTYRVGPVQQIISSGSA